MKSASVKELKVSLELLSPQELISLCLRLSRFKKDNKELLSYLLFEAQDEEAYISSVKTEIDDMFEVINIKSVYIAKKNLRKIIRLVNKNIKYSGQDSTAATLLIYLCSKINSSGLDLSKSTALANIYQSLIKKINQQIETMHEDLQYDFNKSLNLLSELN
jgi:hypothetical protein